MMIGEERRRRIRKKKKKRKAKDTHGFIGVKHTDEGSLKSAEIS